ncbi:hypothetical protein [Mycolicibacterium mageritense]|uniref:hypothetical protein n=1 Tax=Mycolicibacterium mageritense TaxID=53462 RepID=UPI001E5AAD91|nr:hypothetical protein [Mycolicibacterium mageritense]
MAGEDARCTCGHLADEHQPVCVAIVEEHERRVYCMCAAFEPDLTEGVTMAMYVRCECMWNSETGERARATDCPVHTHKQT